MEIIKTPSPNFNDRKGCSQPSLIIVHYTGTKTADEAAAYYLNTTTDPNAGPISPHYMIDATYPLRGHKSLGSAPYFGAFHSSLFFYIFYGFILHIKNDM